MPGIRPRPIEKFAAAVATCAAEVCYFAHYTSIIDRKIGQIICKMYSSRLQQCSQR
jgi:hypothetical protein